MRTSEEQRPRLGIVAHAPIQYHTPLYQLLAQRNRVRLDVLFLSDQGFRATMDPGFGQSVAWDIGLLDGYPHRFLAAVHRPADAVRRVRELADWLTGHDSVVVNGYTSPWMLLAMTLCRIRGIPYLLRASAHPDGLSTGLRRLVRRAGTRAVVAGSAGALSMGLLNDEFYQRTHARSVTFAPNSVDNRRFAVPAVSRSVLLARWGLPDDRPVIVFSGKLIPRKRPLDLAAAIQRLDRPVVTLFIGDGVLAGDVREWLSPGCGVVTGFVNQSDLPSYYHAADILVLPSEAETWGLVVNEAMAAGVLPVVSDRVGCAPDLVRGVGEVFHCGDVPDLTAALARALARIRDPSTRHTVRQHAERYSITRTANGFEQAAVAVGHRGRATERTRPVPTHSNRATASGA